MKIIFKKKWKSVSNIAFIFFCVYLVVRYYFFGLDFTIFEKIIVPIIILSFILIFRDKDNYKI